MENDVVVAREIIAFYGRNPCPTRILYGVVQESEMMRTSTGKPVRREIFAIEMQAIKLKVMWAIGKAPLLPYAKHGIART